MVYLVIGCIGLGVLALSLVLGDIMDLSGHIDSLGGSDLFSTAALSAFAGAFGFTGFIIDDATHEWFVAIPIAVVVGVVFAAVVIGLTRFLQRGTSDAPRTASLVGAEGTVLSAIPSDGFGEIRVLAGGQPLKLNARSDEPLPQGARVWVSAIVSSTAVEARPATPIDPIP